MLFRVLVICGIIAAQSGAQTPANPAPAPAVTAVGTAQTAVPTIVLDSFDSVTQWRTIPAEGVEISVHPDSGLHGRAMRIDFDFHGHGGYAVVHRDIAMTVPANYEFSFAIRGDAPSNTLEFKMPDSTNENVWW